METQIAELSRTRTRGFGAAVKREGSTLAQQVHPEDAATGSLQQLNRDLPEQPKPDHRDRIAERDFRGSNAVETDRAQRTESSLLKRGAERRIAGIGSLGNLCD